MALSTAALPAHAQEADADTQARLRAALPPGAAEMIDTAVRANDASRLKAVVDVAKATWPDKADAIAAYEKAARAQEKEIRYSRIEQSGFFSFWTGNISVGGSSATGNSDSNNYVVSARIDKDGPRWSHAADFDLAYSFSSDDDPTKRASGSWQSNYKLGPRRFVFGRFGYLKNASSGIRNRFIESVGVGSRFIDTRLLTWDVTVGPAARQTAYYDGSQVNDFALRVANRGSWQFATWLRLSNENSIYLTDDFTLDNTTRLTSSLTSKLTVTISFNVQWEEQPALTYSQLSTLSSITIGYDF